MRLLPQKAVDTVDALREEGRSAVGALRGACNHALTHSRALLELFRLEMREYGAHQARRAAAVAVALLSLLFGYLLLCAFVCTLLSTWLGWLWALGGVCLFHFLVAGILIGYAVKSKPGPLAPATRQELKNDLQCLQILLKDEKEKS